MLRREEDPEDSARIAAFTDDEWDEKVSPLLVLGPSMESLLRSLISATDTQVHSIQHRVKQRSSVTRKIDDRNREDYNLSSLTDILGVRVITYFDQEVDHIAEIIEREFGVDRENSVDKRKALDPDRFGYLSLHYVVQLNGPRAKLTEYQDFKAIKFEIQVRTILQHAWAEIEHDLGYKSKAAIPPPIRRQFSRLAGLLELADIEFTKIRKDMGEYERSVENAVDVNEFDEGINRESMTAYIRRSALLKRLEITAATRLGRERSEKLSPGFASMRAAGLRAIGLSSLSDVERLLNSKGDLLVNFVDLYFHRTGKSTAPERPMSQGLLLHYLIVSELLERPVEEFTELSRQAKLQDLRRDLMMKYWDQAKKLPASDSGAEGGTKKTRRPRGPRAQ